MADDRDPIEDVIPSLTYGVATMDDAVRRRERVFDAIRRAPDRPDPATLAVREIPDGEAPDAQYQVLQTQTVPFRGSSLRLARDSTFRLGRYGRDAVNGWIREPAIGLLVARVTPPGEAAAPAPEAPVEKAARKPRAKKTE